MLNSIGPLCTGYCLARTFLPAQWRLPLPLECYAVAESVFLATTYLYRRFYVQKASIHPEPVSSDQRRKLFEKTLDDTQDYEAYISKWFLGASVTDIKRENMKEFLRWAFFNLGEEDQSYDAEVERSVRSSKQSLRRFMDGL